MTRTLVVDLAATSQNWSLPAAERERLRTGRPGGWLIRFVDAPTVSDGDGSPRPSAEAVAAIGDAEAYFGFGISPPLFTAGRDLRWVHSAAAGVGAVLFPELVASDVVLTNSAGVHGPPIAEHVVGGVLYLCRGFDVAVAQRAEGRWDKTPFVGDPALIRELAECHALVVGAGGLGSEIARRLSGLGVTCTGVRRRPALGAPSGFAGVVGPASLDDELARADILVLAVPLTSATRALITAARLARLPVGAIVVNVARGALLDEAALLESLDSGHIRGAVLDVFAEEPLPATSRLWQASSVLLTPHVAAVSPRRFWRRQLDLFMDNWRRYTSGEPLRNVVDKSEGY